MVCVRVGACARPRAVFAFARVRGRLIGVMFGATVRAGVIKGLQTDKEVWISKKQLYWWRRQWLVHVDPSSQIAVLMQLPDLDLISTGALARYLILCDSGSTLTIGCCVSLRVGVFARSSSQMEVITSENRWETKVLSTADQAAFVQGAAAGSARSGSNHH